MTDQRDPYLPPPEVVDWLLAQEWGQPIDISQTNADPDTGRILGTSNMYCHVLAIAALGCDHIIDLTLDGADALDLLRADRQWRDAQIDAKRKLAEQDDQQRKQARESNRPCELQHRQASPTADICADDVVWGTTSITAHSIVINGQCFRLVPEEQS